MSDSTSLLEQIDGSQAQHEVTANNLFDASSPSAAYGRHAEACAGLTWGYYGTRYGGTAVANGTNACGASTTTYMVVNLSTGAVSFSTATTNWNDSVNYARCYKIVTGASSVTSYEDHRFGPLGVFSAAGAIANLADLADVDLSGSPGPQDGDVLSYYEAGGVWIAVPPEFISPTSLEDMTDVDIAGSPSPADGSALVFDAGSGKWIAGEVGFRNIPQNIRSAAYTALASDAGKHLLHPSADTTARIFTIDSNANVPYEVGTVITFVNQNGAGTLTISLTSDTMRLAGAGTTGSRTLAANGVATALKITSTEWIISGTGLT